MKIILICLACWIAVGIAAPEKGLFLNLDNGELCIGSFQCESDCCQRDTALSLSRCFSKGPEGDLCSDHFLYNIYYRCPCERGLKCDGDKSFIGSITNTNFGTCKDPNDITKVIQPKED
uniref:Colipase, pancreatic n=1 Tax=Callorhinchus milii TaxID=7868 RepID=K4G6J6_CALMI|nr:colipase, pancreatic [Callorhinchus milii]